MLNFGFEKRVGWVKAMSGVSAPFDTILPQALASWNLLQTPRMSTTTSMTRRYSTILEKFTYFFNLQYILA
jgi:hypothetical protein